MDEQRNEYKPIYIDRRTGAQQEASYTVKLYDWQVIPTQIELSTSATVYSLKMIKKGE